MPRTPTKKPSQSTVRKLKPSRGKLFKRVKIQSTIPSAWQIFKTSVAFLYLHKKIFGSLSLIYLGLNVLLVRGFGLTTDLSLAKQAFEELFNGAGSSFTSSAAIFGFLVNSNSPGTEVASVYQSIIIVIVSLAVIWVLRQTHAREKVSLKDAFYKSTYPLVPFLFVLMFIGLQLLPLVLGSFLFSATVGSGTAIGGLETIMWSTASFILVLWSAYMVSASIFALYIVTLPDMPPLKALRSAKKLVQFRRSAIIRKLIFLPVILMVLMAVIMFPIIMFLTPIAEVVFIILATVSLPIAHSYIYSLYRELL
jgi:hypothetical protein